ncbi:MAG TPA: DUF1015 domain-containing protein, partial [Actinomycetota bacterium]|nr:DUF1015 domain-containing protein [Actinomycetota bacterium]
MSLVSPFVGLLFDGSVVGSPDQVTTPPYDVISDDERRHYLNASPYNVIRLVLGWDDADDDGTVDKYRRAASELETWRERGALAPTERPSFYPYEMRFSLHGRRRAIRGMVCAVELEDRGGSIVPHERTMPGPVEDRLRLMRAVRTNLSSIHAVFRGPSEPFAGFLDDAMARGHAASTTDEAGVEHTLWVSEPNPEVATWLAAESLMIADGHHRYSMALRYRDEMRAEHGPGQWDRVMMFIADAAIQEPPVLPFHRIQTGGPHEASGTRVRDLAEVLETVSDEKLVVGSASLEDGLLVHRIAELPGTPPAVCALHERVLEHVDAQLRFTPDAVEAEDAVRSREAVAAFLDDAMTLDPAATTTDEAGVEHTLWVTEPNPEVATWLAPESLMIADG